MFTHMYTWVLWCEDGALDVCVIENSATCIRTDIVIVTYTHTSKVCFQMTVERMVQASNL